MSLEEGQFKKYRATTKIHLGSINKDIAQDAIIEYDGTATKWAGEVHHITAIAGAIRLGWLVPYADKTTQYVPQPAGVQVRPATSAHQERGEAMRIETATDDEREVASLDGKGHLMGRDAAQAPQQRQAAAPEAPKKKYEIVHDDVPTEYEFRGSKEGAQVGPPKKVASKFTTQEDMGAEYQQQSEGAKPIARLGSAVQKTVLTDDSVVSREMAKVDAVRGEGLKVRKIAAITRTNEDAEHGTPIAQHHKSGATGDVDETMTGDELTDILPDAISSGRPRAGVAQSSETQSENRIKWDKTAHWKVRVKKAVDEYGNDRNAIRQILEIEDDAVVKHIRQALSKTA